MKATFLSRFTPSLMVPEALEAIFVQRETLAERIIALIHDSALTPSKHHTLLIGPRGIGKTHLVALVYHRIRAMEDLRDRLLIAWLREEEWGVVSFLDLLLRIFRALLAEFDDVVLAERVESLYSLTPEAAERAGATLLKEFVGGRTLLVLMENLDDLFDGLGDEGQKRLRSYLQENPLFTILATAQSLFNGVALRTSPFYGFFRIHHLGDLDFDEATLLLTKLSDFEGDIGLASFIRTPKGRARIRAAHHLAGGNHRVYIIFSQFLTRESLDELVEPFMRTLDDLTPYYQARMTYLSPQQRKIVELLCDRRNAIPVKKIAQRCFITHQTASSQLKDLRDKGYVSSIPVGRESYYELRELLMRLCIEVKKHRGEPIRLFVDFLRLWYSPAELEQRLALLQPDAALESDATIEREYLLHALQVTEEETEDLRVAACLKDSDAYIEAGDFTSALEVAEELVAIRGHAQDWFRQGLCLVNLERWDKALASYDKAIGLEPNVAPLLGVRGGILVVLGRYDEALASYDKAIELEPNNPLVWRERCRVLGNLGRHNEALASYDKVIKLEPNDASAWLNRGRALVHLERYDEALASFDKAIELEPNDASAWSNQGAVLDNLSRYAEALASYNKVTELKPNDTLAWLSQGSMLDHLGHHDEALASYNKAIELDPNDASTWLNRGKVLDNLGRHDEALESFDKAIEIKPNDASVWHIRAVVLYEGHQRLKEALECLDKAVELDLNDPVTWSNRGVALSSLGRHDEALESYDKAIELGGKHLYIPFNRAAALMALNRWDEGVGALDDALCRFTHTGETDTGDEMAIVRNLFIRTKDEATWHRHIKIWIEHFNKHQVVSALGQGLVRSIPALNSPSVSDAAARMWRDMWQELAGDYAEFQIPLRLLDTAVRYRETDDERVLLQLPLEERQLLEPLLKESPSLTH